MPRIVYDQNGTPGILAVSLADAYEGIGWLHGHHRPLQSLLLGAIAKGISAPCVFPVRTLRKLDHISKQLGIPELALKETNDLDQETATWVDAYVQGFAAGLKTSEQPWWLKAIMARLPLLDRQAILGGLLISAYLGLAEGQQHMEQALCEAVAAKADIQLLERLFSPHLNGWDPLLCHKVGCQVKAPIRLSGAFGSNAWAIKGEKAAGSKPMLCGDPHLQINQLPSVLFEIRVTLASNYWLGATIPGLPAMAVGRNAHMAWSGTFACADNIDHFVEFSAHACTVTACWAGCYKPAETLAAFMRLPTCSSAEQAQTILARAHSYSLHFVLADTANDIRYCQLGRIPKRRSNWSGLYPVRGEASAWWPEVLASDRLPKEGDSHHLIISANESRTLFDGTHLATLAQPEYRRKRIQELLEEIPLHDLESMKKIQGDVTSKQGLLLRPLLLHYISAGTFHQALSDWDGRYHAESVGATCFERAYFAVWESLAPELGGEWLTQQLTNSELSIWWCRAFDNLIVDPSFWTPLREERLRKALSNVAKDTMMPWGEYQQLFCRHLVAGGLPAFFGLDRGPYPLEGSRATINQGNVVLHDKYEVAVGPAYRMICDLSTNELWTSLPGGIDQRPGDLTYDLWLSEWRTHIYHRLKPPSPDG